MLIFRMRAAAGPGFPRISQNTGLMPFLAVGPSLDGSIERPWDHGEFGDPAETGGLDDGDVAQVLEWLWDAQIPGDDEMTRTGRRSVPVL